MGGAGRRGAEAAASSQPAEAAAQKPLLLVAAAAVPCHSRDQAVARPAPPSEHSAPSPVIIIYSYHSLVFSDGLDIHIYYLWIYTTCGFVYLLVELYMLHSEVPSTVQYIFGAAHIKPTVHT